MSWHKRVNMSRARRDNRCTQGDIYELYRNCHIVASAVHMHASTVERHTRIAINDRALCPFAFSESLLLYGIVLIDDRTRRVCDLRNFDIYDKLSENPDILAQCSVTRGSGLRIRRRGYTQGDKVTNDNKIYSFVRSWPVFDKNGSVLYFCSPVCKAKDLICRWIEMKQDIIHRDAINSKLRVITPVQTTNKASSFTSFTDQEDEFSQYLADQYIPTGTDNEYTTAQTTGTTAPVLANISVTAIQNSIKNVSASKTHDTDISGQILTISDNSKQLSSVSTTDEGYKRFHHLTLIILHSLSVPPGQIGYPVAERALGAHIDIENVHTKFKQETKALLGCLSTVWGVYKIPGTVKIPRTAVEIDMLLKFVTKEKGKQMLCEFYEIAPDEIDDGLYGLVREEEDDDSAGSLPPKKRAKVDPVHTD